MNELALCSGIGGLSLGLRIAVPGCRCICHVEREAYCAATLVARMEDKTMDKAPIWDDVESFDGKPWRGIVDIITSGDPCQPFSVAGQRKGEADERYIWDDIARIIREVEPEFVFLENVPGAIDFRHGCKADLEGLGYRVEAGLFSAAEVGAPIRRPRIFLLASTVREGYTQPIKRATICAPASRIKEGATAKLLCGELGALFPPAPEEDNAWRERIHDESPIIPAFYRGIDRVASKLDTNWSERIAAVGNAVVPMVAALAFRTLFGRLNTEHRRAE